MITIQGKPSGKFSTILGIATFEKKRFYNRSKYILIADRLDKKSLGYKGCITSGGKGAFYQPDHVYEANIEKIKEGDIISIDDRGLVVIEWETNSHQNSLLLTETCNCHCIMCPQPPRTNDVFPCIRHVDDILDLLKGRKVSQICITGGEPTNTGDEFIRILKRCEDEHPNAFIDVLSNGKNFADADYCHKMAKLTNGKVTFCISLHSDLGDLFDKIAGSKGSFSQVQKGIYNLAKTGFPVEIRTVISKLNYMRLKNFAEHLYNYFPFCCHYAFMGMEIHGLAEKNLDLVNIFPTAYKKELKEAVLSMDRRGLPVSIYNIPHCCLCPEVRQFARQSISAWKNIYLPQCVECSKHGECAGFFATSSVLPVNDVRPI